MAAHHSTSRRSVPFDDDDLGLPESDFCNATYARHNKSLVDWGSDLTESQIQEIGRTGIHRHSGLDSGDSSDEEESHDVDRPASPRDPNNRPKRPDMSLSGDASGEPPCASPPVMGLVTILDLQEASFKGDIDLVRELLQAGVQVNTPLMWEDTSSAARKEKARTAFTAPQILCRAEDAALPDPEFTTLLHILSSRPDLQKCGQIISEVIAAKADVNSRSSSGSTPLAQACFHRHLGAAEALLASGADVGPVDDLGRNAIINAKEGGEMDTMASRIIALLTMNGATQDAPLPPPSSDPGGAVDATSVS